MKKFIFGSAAVLMICMLLHFIFQIVLWILTLLVPLLVIGGILLSVLFVRKTKKEKKGHVKKESESTITIPKENRQVIPNPDTLSFDEKIRLSVEVSAHSSFESAFKTLGTYLSECQKEHIDLSGDLLERIEGLTSQYLYIKRVGIENQKTEAFLKILKQTLTDVNASMESTLKAHIEKKCVEIETETSLLRGQLRAEGLMNSEFETLTEH